MSSNTKTKPGGHDIPPLSAKSNSGHLSDARVKHRKGKAAAPAAPKPKPAPPLHAHTQNRLQVTNFHDLSPEEEVKLMAKAESEQTVTDRFWGLDKQALNIAHEKKLMMAEEERSIALDNYCKKIQIVSIWEDVDRQYKMEDAYAAAVEEAFERKKYLEMFSSITSSLEVMTYQWPTKPHIKPLPPSMLAQMDRDDAMADQPAEDGDDAVARGEAGPTGPSSKPTSGTGSRRGATGDNASGGGGLNGAVKADFVLKQFVSGDKSTVHLDGMQKTRVLAQALAYKKDKGGKKGVGGGGSVSSGKDGAAAPGNNRSITSSPVLVNTAPNSGVFDFGADQSKYSLIPLISRSDTPVMQRAINSSPGMYDRPPSPLSMLIPEPVRPTKVAHAAIPAVGPIAAASGAHSGPVGSKSGSPTNIDKGAGETAPSKGHDARTIKNSVSSDGSLASVKATAGAAAAGVTKKEAKSVSTSKIALFHNPRLRKLGEQYAMDEASTVVLGPMGGDISEDPARTFASEPYIPAYHGHSAHKWEQNILLTRIFEEVIRHASGGWKTAPSSTSNAGSGPVNISEFNFATPLASGCMTPLPGAVAPVITPSTRITHSMLMACITTAVAKAGADIDNKPKQRAASPKMSAADKLKSKMFGRGAPLSAAESILKKNDNKNDAHQALRINTNMSPLLELFQFTVFGAWIKKRQFHLFDMVFANAPGMNDSAVSAVTGESGAKNASVSWKKDMSVQIDRAEGAGLTMSEWLRAAKAVAQETHVAPNKIRLLEEHKEACIAEYSMKLIDQNRRKVAMTAKNLNRQGEPYNVSEIQARNDRVATKYHASIMRNMRAEKAKRNVGMLRRVVDIGDVVWGLFGDGVMWLPAVVTGKHHSDGSFDLVYPQCNAELGEIKESTISKAIVDSYYAPNRMGSYTNDNGTIVGGGGGGDAPNEDIVMPPPAVDGGDSSSSTSSTADLTQKNAKVAMKPDKVMDERTYCAYAFGLVDTGNAGELDTEMLISRLASPYYRQVIEASLPLQLLFSTHMDASKSKRDQDMSFLGLLRMKPTTTKLEFIELCMCLGEMSSYQLL